MARDSPEAGRGESAPPAATAFTAPQLSLPKGGGALRSIGEKFAANPVTGTGSLTIPIATSPGRCGFGPQLALAMIPESAMAHSGLAGTSLA